MSKKIGNIPTGLTLKKKIMSGGSWALSGKLFSVVTGFLINILLARNLPPSDLGLYFLIISITTFTTALGTLGLPQLTVRIIAENVAKNKKEIIKNYIYKLFILILCAALFTSLLTYFSIDIFGKQITKFQAISRISLIISSFVFIAILQKIIAEIYRGFNDIKLFSLLSGPGLYPTDGILIRFFFITGIISVLYLNPHLSISFVIICLLISDFFAIAITVLLFARKYNFKFSRKYKINTKFTISTSMYLLKDSWPLLINNLMIFTLAQADIWIISFLNTTTNTAIYGTAKRFVSIWIIPTLIFRTFIAPIIAELYSQGEIDKLKVIIQTIVTVIAIPTILSLIPLYLWGDSILGFIYGSFYSHSYIILVILSLNAIFTIFSGIGEELLYMTGHQKITMNIFLVTGIILLFSGYFGVRHFQATGMASSFVGSMVFMHILIIYFAKAKTGILPIFTNNYTIFKTNIYTFLKNR